jgi:hypothetical protein
MSFDDSTYYQIEAYLNGELSSEEHIAFEKKVSENKELFQLVEKHKLANALIVEKRLLSVKNILQEEQSKGSDRSNYKLYAVTGLAILATAVGIISYKNNSNPDKNPAATINSITKESNNFSSYGTEEKQIEGKKSSAQVEPTITGTGLHKQEIQAYEQAIKEGRTVEEFTAPANESITSTSDPVNNSSENKESIDAIAAKDVCADVVIKAQIKTSPTCRNESSGEILVYNIQGGTKPYTVSLSDMEMSSVINGQLSKGTYQAFITDMNGCEQKYLKIYITEKECSVDYSFNPFMGEKWQVDPYSSNGQLQLYNKGGVLYYQENIEANTTFEWSGIGHSNQILPGYYIFVIKYSDGTVKRGSVTIVQ